eukprot:gene4768-34522_t
MDVMDAEEVDVLGFDARLLAARLDLGIASSRRERKSDNSWSLSSVAVSGAF